MQNAQSKISDQTTFQTYDSVQKYDDGITEKREFAITEHTMDTKHFLCRRSQDNGNYKRNLRAFKCSQALHKTDENGRHVSWLETDLHVHP